MDDLNDKLTGAPKPKPKSAKIVAIGLVVVAALCGSLLVAELMVHGSIRFMVRHDHYVPIVAGLRARMLAPGELHVYRIVNPSNIAAVREDTSSTGPQRGEGAGCVWAQRDSSGRLRVAIETIDRGHAGEFGYLYADTIDVPPTTAGRSIEGPGREWTLDRYLGDGWWRISNRLD